MTMKPGTSWEADLEARRTSDPLGYVNSLVELSELVVAMMRSGCTSDNHTEQLLLDSVFAETGWGTHPESSVADDMCHFAVTDPDGIATPLLRKAEVQLAALDQDASFTDSAGVNRLRRRINDLVLTHSTAGN